MTVTARVLPRVWRVLALLPALAAAACAVPGGAPGGAATAAARLPQAAFGYQRVGSQLLDNPRLGPMLAVAYRNPSGPFATVFLYDRAQPGLGGGLEGAAARTEYDAVLTEARAATALPGNRRVAVRDSLNLRQRDGQPALRCWQLLEERDGQSLGGLRCLGILGDRFARVYVTTLDTTPAVAQGAALAMALFLFARDGNVAAVTGPPATAAPSRAASEDDAVPVPDAR